MPKLKPRPPRERVLYSITEAAEVLGRNRRTIHRWINTGVLQTVEIPGSNRMISAASIQKLLAMGRATRLT